MSDVEYALHLGKITTPDRRELSVHVYLVINIDYNYFRQAWRNGQRRRSIGCAGDVTTSSSTKVASLHFKQRKICTQFQSGN